MQELEPDYLLQEELEQTYLVHMFQWLTSPEKEHVIMYLEGFVPNDVQEECWSTGKRLLSARETLIGCFVDWRNNKGE